MKTVAILSLIVASVLFADCKGTLSSGGNLQAEQDPVEGMVFLTFIIRSDSISGKEVKLISKIVVAQKQKSDPVSVEGPNRIIIRQTDNYDKILSATSVDHPLLKRVEFADDEGKFQSRSLTLKEAEFATRVTLYRETEYIQVVEELSGKVVYTARFKMRE